MQKINRLDLYGIKFSDVGYYDVLSIIKNYDFKRPAYICFPSTNIVAKVQKNEYLKSIFNNSFLTLADGKFTEYYFRIKGNKNIQNVSGFWLLKDLLNSKLSHYFYGGNDETLYKVKTKIESKYQNATVLGYKAPPFIRIEEIADNELIRKDIDEINQLAPDLIWIGISNLKQDVLMHHFHNKLQKGLMLGVGAVFLYMSGEVKKGPEWIKKLGLRWLVRIIQEPRKEFRKTVPSILFFLVLLFNELFKKIFKRNAPSE